MFTTGILDLKGMVRDGRLYSPPDDGHRIDAFIPAIGAENHAPNMVELPDGEILCTWFAGTAEGIPDTKIVLSRLPAGSAQWTRPVQLSDDPDRSEQNPMLFLAPDGRLYLFYTAQLTRGGTKQEWLAKVAAGQAEGDFTMQFTAIIRCRLSDDLGHTWGPVQVFHPTPTAFCRQPMLVLSNGDWLFPFYYSLPAFRHADDYTVMRISPDRGQTWHEYTVPQSRGRVQASVVEMEPGRLLAFMRSRAADRIYVSRSTDYGRTWTPPQRTVLPNNNGSIQALRLASGNLAVVFNDYSANDDPERTVWPDRRWPVTVAISGDGGETWPWRRHLDHGEGFCGEMNEHLNRRLGYPCIMQSRDGLLHIGYSYRRRQCIKYVRVSEAWVRDQRDYLYTEA